ncbi:hypothetical protein ACIRXL_08535 [Avibacterium paragallinarum]|uniref:hypothetical protein n=1 Tax=Avibacterium paragallinarum TaxID=728 RepID=UPI00397BDFBC
MENNYLSPKDVQAFYKDLERAIKEGKNVDEVYDYYSKLSQQQRDELLAECDATCRLTVKNAINSGTELAYTKADLLSGWLSGLSSEERSRFLMLVENENNQTISELRERQTLTEKALELGLDTARFLRREDGGLIPSNQHSFAKKTKSQTSAIPVNKPTEVKVSDGKTLIYQSNPKHTLGQSSNRSNAGIEPSNALELFKNSVVSGKKRYALDSEGRIHQFNADKEGKEWHWAGRTGKDQPKQQRLSLQDIDNNVYKQLGTHYNEVRKK